MTGYGGPDPPAIVPEPARERILADHPDLVTARHPMTERWWEDFDRYTRVLVEHVDEVAEVCRLTMELEPELSLLCVDFMSSDHAGHLGYDRLDPAAPRPRPGAGGRRAGPCLPGSRPRLRGADRPRPRAVGRGADGRRPLRPRHEAHLLDVPCEPLARGERPSALPPPLAAAASPGAPGLRGEGRSAADANDRAIRARARPRPPASAAGRRPRVRRHRLRLDASLRVRHRRADLPRRGERRRPRPALRGPARGRAGGRAPSGDREARLRGEEEGGALPRPVPGQGARARPPAARRAHPRRRVAQAVAGGLRPPRAARPGDLLRVLGPPRAHGHPRRRRARDRLQRGAGGRRDHAARPHALPPPRNRARRRRRGADRGDPGRRRRGPSRHRGHRFAPTAGSPPTRRTRRRSSSAVCGDLGYE